MSRIKSVCIGMCQYGISAGLNLFLSKHVAVLIHHLGNFGLALHNKHEQTQKTSFQQADVYLFLSRQLCV